MMLFEWTLLLLLAAVLLAALARRLEVPYPALLALAGAVLAFFPIAPEIEIDPELALALFVAPVLLDAAFDKLRPGAPIVLETINPACWFAFFESYIRDVTHVRPIHPDTLRYLLIATGFQEIDIRYRAPYPEHEKLQPVSAPREAGVPGSSAIADWADTLNANVEKINRLLFTWLDYAAIGRRP